MREVIVESRCEEDTYELGFRLGQRARAGDVCLLIGGLGAGKTALAKGVAAGLGIEEPISSPTFTLVQEYEGGRLPLYHFDLYRIAHLEEMEEIGFEDYLYGKGLCLIEWGSLIEELLPGSCFRVYLEREAEKGFGYRRITIEGIEGIG